MALGTQVRALGGGLQVGSAYGIVSVRSDTAGIARVQSALKGLNPAMKGIGIVSSAMAAGLTAAGAAISGLGLAIGDGIRRFATFDKNMDRVGALIGPSGLGGKFDELTAQARELGRTTVFTANEVAEGMQFLAMTGFDANEVLESMPGLLNVATAGQLDLARTADLVSNILRGFNLEASESSRVGDVLTAAFTGSNVDLQMLGNAMKYVGPVAADLGFTIEEMAAAVGALGDAGIQGSMAGTHLKMALLRIAAPTKKASDIMKKYGIELVDAEGNIESMSSILGELSSKLSGLSETARAGALKEIVGARAAGSFQALMRSFESGHLQEFTTELENSAGRAEQIAKEQLDNLAGDVTLFRSMLDDVMMSIGEIFEPLARETVQGLTKFLEENRDEILEFFTNIRDWLVKIRPIVMNAAEAIWDAVNAFAEFAAPYVVSAIDTITNFVQSLQWLYSMYQQFGAMGIVKGIWYLLTGGDKPFPQEEIDKIQDFITGLDNVLRTYQNFGLLPAAQSLWRLLFGEFMPIEYVGALSTIENGIKAMMNYIMGIASGDIILMDVFNDFVEETRKLLSPEVLGEFADEWITFFWGEFGKVANSILEWATSPTTQASMQEFGRLLADGYLRILESAFTSLSEGSGPIGNLIKSTLAIGSQITAGFLAGIVEGLTGNEIEIYTIAELKNLFTNISKAFEDHGLLAIYREAVSQFLYSVFEGLQEFGTNLIDAYMHNIFIAAIDGITAWMEVEREKVMEIFSGVGGDIMFGIMEGMLSFALGPYVAKQVMDKLRASFEDAAEIQSPSKLFEREIGKPIGAGTIEGIRKTISAMTPQIDGSMMNLSNQMGNLSPAYAGLPSESNSYQFGNIEIVIPGSSYPQETARLVRQEIQTLMSQAKRKPTR